MSNIGRRGRLSKLLHDLLRCPPHLTSHPRKSTSKRAQAFLCGLCAFFGSLQANPASERNPAIPTRQSRLTHLLSHSTKGCAVLLSLHSLSLLLPTGSAMNVKPLVTLFCSACPFKSWTTCLVLGGLRCQLGLELGLTALSLAPCLTSDKQHWWLELTTTRPSNGTDLESVAAAQLHKYCLFKELARRTPKSTFSKGTCGFNSMHPESTDKEVPSRARAGVGVCVCVFSEVRKIFTHMCTRQELWKSSTGMPDTSHYCQLTLTLPISTLRMYSHDWYHC